MAVTKEDLRNFHRFADEKIDKGAADSLVDLANQWETQRPRNGRDRCRHPREPCGYRRR